MQSCLQSFFTEIKRLKLYGEKTGKQTKMISSVSFSSEEESQKKINKNNKKKGKIMTVDDFIGVGNNTFADLSLCSFSRHNQSANNLQFFDPEWLILKYIKMYRVKRKGK